jgi:hypothetical protein
VQHIGDFGAAGLESPIQTESMSQRKELLHRLLLAKSILSLGRSAICPQPNVHLVARNILSAHDAADLVFAAIADQQNRLPAKSKDSMIQCLAAIDIKGDRHDRYFKQLNEARNSLKHSGVLPNTNSWATVLHDVFEKLSEICRTTLDVSLEGLDESDLILNAQAKAHLLAARAATLSGDFRLALEEIGKALLVSLEGCPAVGDIEVGKAKAEDALKLSAFGVPANDFLRLQEFLPRVHANWTDVDKFECSEPEWKQSGFGHPGNWRAEVAEFCLAAYLNVALSVQNAPPVPYAREFSHVYSYKVTARKDQVEVWEDLVAETGRIKMRRVAPDENPAADRPFRKHKRSLSEGESLEVSAYTRPLISDDLSSSGEPIKRVRITYDLMYSLFPDDYEVADFVNLDDVRITCVPRLRHPDLSEIPWEEDPLLE